jgi:hypothetical protein
LAGTGFHFWNVLKRPGRLDWQNLFYGAPVGAPMAILLAGLLGTAAEWVRDTPGHELPRLFGIPAGRALAAQVRKPGRNLSLNGESATVMLHCFNHLRINPFTLASSASLSETSDPGVAYRLIQSRAPIHEGTDLARQARHSLREPPRPEDRPSA